MQTQETIDLSGTEEKKIEKLKLKCNRQLDKIMELDKMLKIEEEKNKNLEIRLRHIQNTRSDTLERNGLIECLNCFCRILKKIIDNDDFIPYKNYTKNSARFCKVEKALFDRYIEADPDIDRKNFFDYCIDFALLKADENRKIVWSDNQDGQSVRIYFINKNLINILNGEYKNA